MNLERQLALLCLAFSAIVMISNMMALSRSVSVKVPTDESSATASLANHRMQHYKDRNSKSQSFQRIGQFRRPRTLIGIISSDGPNECSYRRRHRELFKIWNDSRVCSLTQLKSLSPIDRQQCQIVYTFVIGAGGSDAPTIILNSSYPLLRTKPWKSRCGKGDTGDFTLLNIKENMNEGKSPTFFYFASKIMREYDLDYAMKLDADSILHLHDYFLFAHNHLPPRPYSRGIFAGPLRDKAGWANVATPEKLARLESFWINEYDGVHLYLAGQCYLMSLDLCEHVANEASVASSRIAPGGYLEGHEDADVSSMVFSQDWAESNLSISVPFSDGLASEIDRNRTSYNRRASIRLVTIGKSQRFWEHPVKGQPRWERIRVREKSRMNGTLFEGRSLPLYIDE